MKNYAHAPWIASLEQPARNNRANAALLQLRESLHAAEQAIANAETALREAGFAQSRAEYFLGHDVNFEAASTRIFLQQQLATVRLKIRERAAAVAQRTA